MWCERFSSPQFGHSCGLAAASAWWLRRMLRLEGEVFFFGTAMGNLLLLAGGGAKRLALTSRDHDWNQAGVLTGNAGKHKASPRLHPAPHPAPPRTEAAVAMLLPRKRGGGKKRR